MYCVSQVSVKYVMTEGKQRGWLESIDLMGELCEWVDGCEWVELVCSVNIACVKLDVVGYMGDLLMQMSHVNEEFRSDSEGCRMPLNWGRLKNGVEAKNYEPRTIYSTLEGRRWSSLRPEQAEVLDQWYERRDEKDLLIRQNTGTGKTLTGLLIALASMREAVGPSVYLVPHKYLIKQVVDEAKGACIPVTDDIDSVEFGSQRAILVTTYHKLFNGFSAFGVEGIKDGRVCPGTLVLDDVHSSVPILKSQFSLRIANGCVLYEKVFHMFEEELKAQNKKAYNEIVSGDQERIIPIPFVAVQEKSEHLTDVIGEQVSEGAVDDSFVFSWNLVADVLRYCSITVAASCIEIRPPCPDVRKIMGFMRAKRRVYLTATLQDVGALVTELGAGPESVERAITPKRSYDLGDRLILAPLAINPQLDVEKIRIMVSDFAKGEAIGEQSPLNVVVLVPSDRAAVRWEKFAEEILHVEDMGPTIERLHAGEHVGLVVLVNKYDGVDLPGSACRILVIDGVPTQLSPYERRERQGLYGTDVFTMRTLQQVEQGMGRGTRDTRDYCAVLLLGAELSISVIQSQQYQFYSSATRAQIEASNVMAEQIEGEGIDAIVELLSAFLDRQEEWTTFMREHLARVEYQQETKVAELAKARRKSFDLICGIGNAAKAINILQKGINSLDSTRNAERGWYLEELAMYQNAIDKRRAQETLEHARGLNSSVVRTSVYIPTKVRSKELQVQAESLSLYALKFSNIVDLQLHIRHIFDSILWGELGNADQAEGCIQGIGALLGFESSRPDKEFGDGPDNLWRISSDCYAVIEAKTDVQSKNRISRSHAQQLSHSLNWFAECIDPVADTVPVLIHPSNYTLDNAHVPAGTRVITPNKLSELREAVLALFVELDRRQLLSDTSEISAAMRRYGIGHNQLFDKYAVRAK